MFDCRWFLVHYGCARSGDRVQIEGGVSGRPGGWAGPITTGGEMSETNETTTGYEKPPTQVEYSKRASWRTFLQTLIAFVPTANGVLLALQGAIVQEPFQSTLPSWVFVATNGGIVAGAFLAKVVTQLMANPRVNDWLERKAPRLAARDPR